MKKSLLTSALMVFATATVLNAQNNVSLYPQSGAVCNPMTLSVQTSGNAFNPVSYLWSTGETSPVIEITASGTYTCSITGYLGNSKNMSTVVRSATYNVLPAPQINAMTSLWVCKYDTIRLSAVSGYDAINWSDGSSGANFEKVMNNPGTPGTPALDTMSISYTAALSNLCEVSSETRVLRSIRRPPGVGKWFEGKMNFRLTDSIPASYVLEYLYPVRYEMEFTDTANASNVVTYLTEPGTYKAPANILMPGTAYHVVTTPVINGVSYCHGATSTIGLRPVSSNRLADPFSPADEVSTYRVYDVQGRLLMEHQGTQFNNEWVRDLPSQILMVQRIGETSETIRMQIVK